MEVYGSPVVGGTTSEAPNRRSKPIGNLEHSSSIAREVKHIYTHIAHINPASRAVISNGTTQYSRITEYSGYHEC